MDGGRFTVYGSRFMVLSFKCYPTVSGLVRYEDATKTPGVFTGG
jgi:hypothetical protein